jgi:hypothetical protein
MTAYYLLPQQWMAVVITMMLLTKSEALDLSEVPDQLRERILHFHRILDTPDNFSVSTSSTQPPPERRYPLAGLQEAGPDDGSRNAEPVSEPLELQADLFRFSDRISPPPTGDPTRQILVRMRESKVEVRRRLRTEWQQFLQWRGRRRQRRRMRRRIMKMLQRKLEKRFGPLPPDQWRTIQENSVFKTTKRIIRKKIRQLMRRKARRKRKKKEGMGRAAQGDGRRKKQRKTPGRKRKNRRHFGSAANT